MHSLVISIFLYACETWTLTAESERKIQATEMRYFQRLLGISCSHHVTNEEVRNRIRQATGPYEDLLTTVKKRKLRWYGHTTGSTGLAKTILQGTVQGGRRKGRQKKRWEDNITKSTGLKLGEALRKAENREGWRKVVSWSSLVPRRSTRLRDKWSEVKWNDCETAKHTIQWYRKASTFFGGIWQHQVQNHYHILLKHWLSIYGSPSSKPYFQSALLRSLLFKYNMLPIHHLPTLFQSWICSISLLTHCANYDQYRL